MTDSCDPPLLPCPAESEPSWGALIDTCGARPAMTISSRTALGPAAWYVPMLFWNSIGTCSLVCRVNLALFCHFLWILYLLSRSFRMRFNRSDSVENLCWTTGFTDVIVHPVMPTGLVIENYGVGEIWCTKPIQSCQKAPAIHRLGSMFTARFLPEHRILRFHIARFSGSGKDVIERPFRHLALIRTGSFD